MAKDLAFLLLDNLLHLRRLHQCFQQVGQCPPGYTIVDSHKGNGKICGIGDASGADEEGDTPVTDPAPGDAGGSEGGSSGYGGPGLEGDLWAYNNWSSLNMNLSTAGISDAWWMSGAIKGGSEINGGIWTQGNSVQPGQRPMTGYNFMPSGFKKPARRQVVDVNKYGFTQNVEPSRYVSATHQEPCGFVVPMAKKLSCTQRNPRPYANVINEPIEHTKLR